VQECGFGHEMAARELSGELGALGVGSIVQVRLFQRSANVESPPAVPTALHTRAVAHETPLKTAPEPGGFGIGIGGLGVGSITQETPFQRSAKLINGPGWGSETPTAVQARGLAHDTLFKFVVAPVGLGVGSIAQVEPFQPSASGADATVGDS
jgi:hypothetical protein